MEILEWLITKVAFIVSGYWVPIEWLQSISPISLLVASLSKDILCAK
jgi:hypothetical protein